MKITTNSDIETFFQEIRQTLYDTYPIGDTRPVDSRYIFALGIVGAVALEAIASVRENRRFSTGFTFTQNPSPLYYKTLIRFLLDEYDPNGLERTQAALVARRELEIET